MFSSKKQVNIYNYLRNETAEVRMLRTNYASKWNAMHRPIYHARLEKAAGADILFPPTVETRAPMHHALLSGSLPSLDAFKPFAQEFEGGKIVVLGVMSIVGAIGLVFSVRVEELELTQDVLVDAQPTGKTGARVGVMSFGQPLSTRGTQEAARAVTRFLEERGMHVVEKYF